MAEPARAVIETKLGEIEIEFLPDKAPGHVKNFLDLARKGFYDGTTFHRVIPGFMIQGGCPNTKEPNGSKASHGTGGPGYTIKAEFNDTSHKRGVVSMARAQDPNSAGSQFFVCAPTRVPRPAVQRLRPGGAGPGRRGHDRERAAGRAGQPERADRHEGAGDRRDRLRARDGGAEGDRGQAPRRLPGRRPARSCAGSAPRSPRAPLRRTTSSSTTRGARSARAGPCCACGRTHAAGVLTFKGPRWIEDGVKSREERETGVGGPRRGPGHPAGARLPPALPLPEVPRELDPPRAGDRGGRDPHRRLPRDRGRPRRHPRRGPGPRLLAGRLRRTSPTSASSSREAARGTWSSRDEGDGPRRGLRPADAPAHPAAGEARAARAQPAAPLLDAGGASPGPG